MRVKKWEQQPTKLCREGGVGCAKAGRRRVELPSRSQAVPAGSREDEINGLANRPTSPISLCVRQWDATGIHLGRKQWSTVVVASHRLTLNSQPAASTGGPLLGAFNLPSRECPSWRSSAAVAQSSSCRRKVSPGCLSLMSLVSVVVAVRR